MSAVLSEATAIMSEAFQELTAMQTGLGWDWARNASEHITAQRSIPAGATGALVYVDSYEAILRLNELRAQLETAHAAAGRLQDLSLMTFL